MTNIAEIAERQLHDPFYLKTVTELGNQQPLVTSCDVYSTSGIKLVNRGTKFDGTLYQKLLRHKLTPKLDQCMEIENAITNADLATEATLLLAHDSWLQLMQSAMPDVSIFGSTASRIPLHRVVAFKLTVMREKRPDLFKHSLYLMLVCIYIGTRLELDSDQLAQLSAAALLHDIGIMHIDPELLTPGHTLSDTERRHLYAHPLTAWMILKECTDYPPVVLDAVLQHHERLDGSGYPLGLKGEDIDLYGRVLAVAEIIASRHGDIHSPAEKMRLEAILKLNSRRYGRQLIGYLDVFYRTDSDVPSCSETSKQATRKRLSIVLSAISDWETLMNAQHRGFQAFLGMDTRIQNLKMEMLDAGIVPLGSMDNMAGIEESPRACFEMQILLEECIWQLKDVLEEIKRRFPEIALDSPSSCNTQVLNWLIETERHIKSVQSPAMAAPTPAEVT